jgi:hypothetical protein
MKKIAQFICAAIVFLAPVHHALAEEPSSHSLYKVTTYNLGASVDFQDFSTVNPVKYKPLLITSTKADILGADRFRDVNLTSTDDKNAVQGFAIAAEYSPLSKIAVQGVVGVTKNTWDPNTAEHQSSWEANLGVIYKMFGNLRYEMHFGYMDTGDLFKERNSYTDVESIIMISNQLTMSF